MNTEASKKIDDLLASLPDWRKQILAEVRQILRETSPDIEELWKWETPVWAHKGNLVAFGVFQDHVKLNFFQGALLAEVQQVFNAGLEAKNTRAIDFFAGDQVSDPVKKAIRAAFVFNNLKKK